MKWNDLMQGLGGLLLDFLYFGKLNKIYILLRDVEMLVRRIPPLRQQESHMPLR